MADAVTYNIMIHGHCDDGRMDKAHDLFIEMEENAVAPNVITFGTFIHGFSQINEPSKVIELLHKMKEKKVMPDASIVSMVVDLLVKNEISLNPLPSFPVQERQGEIDGSNVKL